MSASRVWSITGASSGNQREYAVDQALQRFGRIDVFVNNAGRTQVGAVEETTDDGLRSLFELHFFAPVAPRSTAFAHGSIS